MGGTESYKTVAVLGKGRSGVVKKVERLFDQKVCSACHSAGKISLSSRIGLTFSSLEAALLTYQTAFCM